MFSSAGDHSDIRVAVEAKLVSPCSTGRLDRVGRGREGKREATLSQNFHVSKKMKHEQTCKCGYLQFRVPVEN
jgi:hypothetical protein